MEPGEPVRSNMDEHTRSNTRRLSSILKAPRTPLKVLAVENEDFQEEQTQKIEKKRKYRRVSFATTNDIMYISSPGRNEDPDITGTNCQKERNCATENVSQQIIGMETLLKAPLHVSQQNKENVFHTDVQHHDSDKTVLFSGEDSAYMDMTHCHTIVIDANADEINSASNCGIANFVSELGMVKSTNSENSLQSDSVFYRSPTASKNQIQESEMGDFVVNSSKKSDGTFTGGKKPTNIFQCSEESVNKTDAHSFFSKLAAQSGIIDKENQYPVTRKLECAEKSVRSFPSKKNALDFDHSVVFSGSDNMDMTESHTVFIDGREILLKNPRRNMEVAHTQTIAADVSQLTAAEKLSKFDQDDMEMTGSQTVVIDAHVTHGMFNPTFHSQKSLLTSREMVPFSENDAGVEMKRGNMTSARETKNCPTENRANVKLFNSVNPVSQWANCSTGQYDDSSPSSKLDARLLFSKLAQKSVTGKENETPVSMGKLQYSTNNQAVLSDPDDMEITRSQTVVIGMANPSLVTAMKSYSKENFSEEDHGMEMTTALTLPIEENCHVTTSDHKAVGQFPPKKPISYGGLPANCGITVNQTATSGVNDWMVGPPDVDMEMTRSQTVVIDSKTSCTEMANSSRSGGRKSLSCLPKDKTVIFSDDDYGMDMTTAHILPIEENCLVATGGDKAPGLFPLTGSIAHSSLPGSSEVSTGYAASVGCSVWTAGSSDADMEMTRSQTIVIDSKTSCNGLSNPSHLDGQKNFSCMPKDKTVIFSEEDYGMEMTTALTLPIEENCRVTTSDHKAVGQFPPKKPISYGGLPANCGITVNQTATSGVNDWMVGPPDVDMEMTRSQTVVIDSKTSCTEMANSSRSGGRKSLSCLPKDKTVIFSDDDYGMDMTTAHILPIEENCLVATGGDKAPGLFPLTGSIAHSGLPGSSEVSTGHAASVGCSVWTAGSSDADMEMTRSQTIVIDSKTSSTGMVTSMQSDGKKSFSYMPKDKTVIFSEEDYGMDMTTALTLPIEENSHIPTTGDKTMERMTPIMKAISEADVLDGTKLTANRLVTARSSISANLSSDSQDMEMTKRQNAVDSKKHSADITNPLFRSRTKTHSYRSANKTNVLSDQDCGVDRTTRVAVPVNKNEQLLSAKDCKETAETLQCAIMAGVEAPVDDINAVISLTSNPKKASGPVLTTDSPNHKRDSLRNETRSRLDTTQISPSCKTFIFSEDDYNIEMTRAGTVRTESHCNAEVATTKYSSANSIVSCLDQLHTGLASSAIYQGGSSKIWTMDQDPKTATSDFSLNVAHSTVPVTDKQAVDIIERSSVPVVLCNDANNVFAVDCAEATSKADCSVKKEDSLSIDPLVSSQKQKKIVKAVSKNPRRVSLADVKSQLENIRGMINEPEDIVNRCLTAPLPQLGSDFEGRETIFESTKCSPNKENFNTQNTLKEHETNLWEDSAVNKQNTNMTAPVNIWERKTPVTRMAFGGFLPKLPQKAKVGDQNNSGGLLKKSVACDTSHQSSSNAVENIEDEILPEISSEEDFTETLESQVPTCTTVEENPSSGSSNLTPLDEPGFVESVQNVIQSLKRSLPVDGHEETVSGERKMRKSPDPNYAGSSIIDIAEENLPSLMTKSLDTINISNSTTFMRADGTFENSAQRCSQYDMDFEAAEYEYDLQKKLEDGSITVREFLKIFAIDFVIHRPRQSVLPDNFALAQKVEDLFVEKYINRPKQRVYEDETRELSKMVEKLKSRMWEQDKPLKTINHSFWESVKSFSEEQFKALGSKLKERKAYFRKKSKAFSHEMKKDLYVNLVQTTQLAEQNLQEKIASVDDLLKNLDECLQDLQSELDLLDSECVNGVNINVNSALLCTLKAKEQELESLNTTVAEKERIIGELKLEKNSTHDKINSMMEETKELEKYKAVMDRLNEWKLCEKTADRAHFNFLYGSVQLEVLFESHANGTEQTVKVVNKVGDIRFHLQLDERNSQDYACLVHKLIAQFIHTKCNWVKEYPTESDIPLLLHDVGLVVSRCRALGEEIHRLKKWGSIKLDILDIACRDTQIKVVFSSLKVSAKFEVTLVVTPAYPVCSLQVLHFQNYIGNIRMYQIEDIVTSIAPSKNYLTRIVKKIHEALLK